MINANELRIGNWVTTSFYSDDADDRELVKVDEGNFKSILDYGGNEFYPIPLTPEIFEKCGFVSSGKKDEFAIKIPDNYYIIVDTKQQIVSIEVNEDWFCPYNQSLSLHQLQNLYFALTGEELEVRL